MEDKLYYVIVLEYIKDVCELASEEAGVGETFESLRVKDSALIPQIFYETEKRLRKLEKEEI